MNTTRSVPACILLLWTIATLGWWAFAFMPLPAAPPEWLSAARYACFGTIASGMPAPHGWIMLVIAPMSFLIAIGVLWGSELPRSLRDVARSRAGRAIVIAVVAAVVVEGAWVSAKVRTALAVERFDAAFPNVPAHLPREYPRQTAIAPAFTLLDQHGKTISLRDFAGRPAVVTFVFAHCQALCPVIVESIKRAAPAAGASEVLLVTLDPWRDTPGSLPALAREWNLPANFHVLSSRGVDDVLDVARAYDVPFDRDEKTGDIEHPGLVFLIDRYGRIAYTFNNPPAAWMRDGLDRLG